jgi:hypothetical protein
MRQSVQVPLRLADRPCPQCGSAMYVRRACCSWKTKGFATIAKCLRAGCGHREGYERRGERREAAAIGLDTNKAMGP